ncbi:MAG: hypothetical protein GX080_01935, partial [Tissierellia bacterium]|nr:hypothetical protein [Tissierellia bacterium]
MVNSYEVFKHAFEPTFTDRVIAEYNKNTDFYGRILQDESFRKKLMEMLMLDIYTSFREEMGA